MIEHTNMWIYKGDKLLLHIWHGCRITAEVEIEACARRAERGEVSHIRIESVSQYGATYVEALRNKAEELGLHIRRR